MKKTVFLQGGMFTMAFLACLQTSSSRWQSASPASGNYSDWVIVQPPAAGKLYVIGRLKAEWLHGAPVSNSMRTH